MAASAISDSPAGSGTAATPSSAAEPAPPATETATNIDVNFQLVKDFLARVEEQSLGEKVLKSVSPGQQIVKIVHDELVRLLGEKQEGLKIAPVGPTQRSQPNVEPFSTETRAVTAGGRTSSR